MIVVDLTTPHRPPTHGPPTPLLSVTHIKFPIFYVLHPTDNIFTRIYKPPTVYLYINRYKYAPCAYFQTCYIPRMNSAITADQFLRELALAIARNQVGAMRPIHEVIAGEGITQTEYDEIAKNPQFQRYVDSYANDLRTNGFSFSAKAKVLAEDLLPTLYHMARDPDTPAAVRSKIAENFVEWADLKPKTGQIGQVGAGFSITINLPSTPEKPAETLIFDANPPVSPAKVLFLEDDSYEYAGEDYCQ